MSASQPERIENLEAELARANSAAAKHPDEEDATWGPEIARLEAELAEAHARSLLGAGFPRDPASVAH